MDTLRKTNIMFLGHTVFEKNAMITCITESCTNVLINNLEILQVSVAFFSDTVRPTNLKFFCILIHMDTLCKLKFDVPRSHSFAKKCDDNLKLASHFSPIPCDRGT